MRIITVNSQYGNIESVVEIRKEKVQQHLFTVHLLVMDAFGHIYLQKITFFQEVEVLVAEEVSLVMACLDGFAQFRLR